MSSDQPASQVSAGANRMGYGPGGIRSGTAAANHMSSTAKSHGGKIPPGSPVAQMQSSGSQGNYHIGGGGGGKYSQPSSQVRAGAKRMGYGPHGIRSGTAAAGHMSSTAKSHGGKIPSGSPVSKMQSAGCSKGGHKSGGGGRKK